MRASSSWAGRIETVLVAAAWSVLVVALSVTVLTIPSFPTLLTHALDVSEEAGLSPEDATALVLAVRAFVVSESADPLPATHDGRAAFDERSVDHLLDVRGVLSGTRAAAGVSAFALAVWIVWSGSRRRLAQAARAVEAGGWTVLAGVAGSGLFALVWFDRAFDLAHGFLFASGTWMFPAGSLLVQLFPEPFWRVSGIALVTLTALGGGTLIMVGRRLRVRGVSQP